MKQIHRIFSLIIFVFTTNIPGQVIVDSMDISTTFYGPFNKTSVTLYLCNHSALDSIEGNFVFNINKTAFIKDMYLQIEGKLKRAHTLPKKQGTTIYEEIIRKRIDPALLLKTGDGSYTLSVYPFLKYQSRTVVFNYYSIIESDYFGLPGWSFKMSTKQQTKSKVTFFSLQEENVDVYQVKGESAELIPSNKTINRSKLIEKQFTINSSSHNFQFDFAKAKRPICYYSDSIKFYQELILPKHLKELPTQIDLRVSPTENFPPDFLFTLIQIIESGYQPSVLALGQDSFLNDFLQYLQFRNKISLSLNEQNTYPISEYIQDSYNWIKFANALLYHDKGFFLIQKPSYNYSRFVKIKCPYLDKFVQYNESLDKSINVQKEYEFLNSNLSKLVIEDDKRAIEIWERVTNKNYEVEPIYHVVVEELPEPIGGIAAIQNSIYYPVSLSPYGDFRIYMLAHINKTGHVIKMEVIRIPQLKNLNNSLVEKVSRFGICFPGWKPGKIRNEPALVQVSIPIVFKADSINSPNRLSEYTFGERKFIPELFFDNYCYFFEVGFEENKSKVVIYKSTEFYELMTRYPEMIELIYKSIYLSKWDGVGFICTTRDEPKHFFIKKN